MYKLYETLSGKEVKVAEYHEPDLTRNYLFPIWGAKFLLKNERDLPLMYMVLNNLIFSVVCIPCIWAFQSHILGLGYLLVNYYIFFGRYMCLNHEYAHIQLFKNKLFGHFISVFLLGHCHGLPFGSYYINHVVMHHKGANAWGVDLSSTERYNRENKLHFVHYWLRRYSPVGFVFDAVLTCFKYKRLKLGISYGICAVIWFLCGLYVVAFSNAYWISGLWTMLLPIFITGLFGAVGGWMQHFFLNPLKPRKWYSYDIINSAANYRGFNQGFHNVHHTLGNLHWTELPEGFISMLKSYDEDNVMIFQTLDNVEIFMLVMAKQYATLAKYLVTTKSGGHSMNDCIQFIRDHLKPVQI